MDRLGFKEGEMIESSMISKSIERAQKKVEENNFGIRKRLLEYDDVMNKQRTVIYEKRRHALMGERLGMDIADMIGDRVISIIENCATFEQMKEQFISVFAMDVPFTADDLNTMKRDDLIVKAYDAALARFKQKTDLIASEAYKVFKPIYDGEHGQEWAERPVMVPILDGKRVYNIGGVSLKQTCDSEGRAIVTAFEKAIMLHVIDEAWKENLRQQDELKHSAQNASYEQKDPLLIYKLESVQLFDKMVNNINNQTISILMRGRVPEQQTQAPDDAQQRAAEQEAQRRARAEAMQRAQYTASRTTEAPRYSAPGYAAPGRPAPGRPMPGAPGAPGTPADLNDPAQQAAAAYDTRGPQPRSPFTAEKLPGRNDPCPCGSGKKFKNCHGRNL
jgi:preprotein translocase subunit SecA